MRAALFSIFFFVTLILSAQDLATFNRERLELTRNGLIILGSWATANIALSPVLASPSSGHRKYFHQMNGYWNVVNLAIAGFGIYGAISADPTTFDLTQSIKEQQTLERLLLFNAGLDLAYMAGGLYLIEKSRNVETNTARLKGFGQSIILQGAFLFTFDVIFFMIQKSHGEKLIDSLSSVSLSFQHVGLVLKF